MTQADVCRETGIATSMISHYCTGQRVPSVQVAGKIAKALNTTVDYLATGRMDYGVSSVPEGLSVAEVSIQYSRLPDTSSQEIDESSLLEFFKSFNDKGKLKIQEYMEDLKLTRKYTKRKGKK